ncbi:hypothetical protein BHE74_00006595 [Ensete ventricosum]|nr:hypothetical protein BHE74_00006595 [Ensete ventricosum]RZS08508.1 hypothetical protein BHM03_00039487 [Ensete ventricosum]
MISGIGLKRLIGRSLPNVFISLLGRADGRKKISGQDGRKYGEWVVPLRSQIEVWPIYKLNEDFSKHIFFECRLAKSSGDCLNRNSSSNFSILIDGIRELG